MEGLAATWGGLLARRLQRPLLPVRLSSRTLHCEAAASSAPTGSLRSRDLAGVAAHLQQCRRVIVLAGAGISVSAGIPDFRTPGTGLYDNLESYGLPYPEAIFDIEFFLRNPRPFYRLCRELWPGHYQPTPTHLFIALLAQKGILQRCYTQNIDSLEAEAGVEKDKIVAAHGNFDGARCLATGQAVPTEELRLAVMASDPEVACDALCKKYGGLVKPDIVFFGENLPARFFELIPEDFPQCDLLLVMGSSLQVQPFAGLVHEVRPGVPRLLLNRERVGEDHFYRSLSLRERFEVHRKRAPGFCFDDPDSQDVFFQGDCDAGVLELVRLLGWQQEFDRLAAASQQRAERANGPGTTSVAEESLPRSKL